MSQKNTPNVLTYHRDGPKMKMKKNVVRCLQFQGGGTKILQISLIFQATTERIPGILRFCVWFPFRFDGITKSSCSAWLQSSFGGFTCDRCSYCFLVYIWYTIYYLVKWFLVKIYYSWGRHLGELARQVS